MNGSTDAACDSVIQGEVTPGFPDELLSIQGSLAPLEVGCFSML